MTTHRPQAHIDPRRNRLVIEALTISTDAVLTEARHWSTGSRGEPVDLAAMADADLAPFVEQALAVGAHALASAGGTQQSVAVHKLISEAEERTTKATEAAAKQTERAVARASETLTRSTAETAKQLTTSIEDANRRLGADLTKLLGGEDSELVRRLQPLLDKVMDEHRRQTATETTSLLEKVSRQFNPADPTSPMAQQMRALSEAQAEQTRALQVQQETLATKVDQVVTALQVKRAHTDVVSRTALKGATYEEHVHPVIAELAAGFGDEYTETGTVTGLRSRNKKGDGVLAVSGGDVRVVIEMTDSERPTWSDYLRNAEENRGAAASLGLAKSRDQLGGQTLLTLGPRRLVLAFDPATDDPQLLRCALQLLRQAAEVAAARVDTGELASADEALTEALAKLEQLTRIKKHADNIRKGATAIETDTATLQTDLGRLVAKARTALAGVHAEAPHEAA